jgi:chemotaxis protein histidine kinase CheA
MAVKTVSTFALPDEYQRQASEARRRRRMAEMLAQQAYQPGDIQNAPIPRGAPLVQGLQAFLAARAARKADEAEEGAMETQTREARQFLKALTDEDTVMDARQPAMPMGAPTVTAPEFEDGRIKTPAQIDFAAPPPMEAPQVQLSRYGNITPGQRRALALEGMLTSQNPILQNVAGAIYPTLQPNKAKLQLGNINPADFTPASIAAAMESGDVSKLQPTAKSGATSTELARLINEMNNLPPNSPLRSIYRQKIAKETNIPGPSVVTYGTPVPAVDAQGNPVLIQPSRTGGAPSVLPGYKPASSKETPPTVSEATSGWNVGRIVNAANAIQLAIEKDPSAIKPSAQEFAAGMVSDEAANAVRSPQRQIVVGEQSDLLDAYLTLATGAAYTDPQFINAKRGLTPTLTDDAAAIERKSKKLLELIPQAKARTGAAWTPELEKAVRDLAASFNKSAPPSTVNPAKGWGKAQQVR